MASATVDEKSQSSFGMSVVLKGIKSKWPNVANITTAELEAKMAHPSQGPGGQPLGPSNENDLIILVRDEGS